MSEMTMKDKLIWAAVGGLVVLGAGFLIWYLQPGDDPPILVGDGSMVIESWEPLADLFDFDEANPSVLKLKNAKAKIRKVKHTGSLNSPDCEKKACAVKATWSNGNSLEVTESNGITITSNPDFNNWDRTSDPYIWRYIQTSDVTNDGLIVTQQGVSPAPPLCSGKGCAARIHYK